MAEVINEAFVPVDPQEAFDIFVLQIDTWWPRQGVFPYSFAPKSTRPLHIHFEAKENGRFYEEFLDGSEYEIGRIVEWRPPGSLVHTWRDPSWEADTLVTVTFSQVEAGTRVVMEQDGFSAIGLADMPPYYEIGNRQTLAGYVAHCVATRELRDLQQGQSAQ